ncbi:MAG: hypothetical protein II797_02695, partial [Clostridia bacterium]|nr:hypothetical protein [Clostridia bacterium]
SRAPVLRMDLFRPSEIRSYLSSHPELTFGESEETIEKIASLSQGTIGQTVALLKDKSKKKAALSLRDAAVRFSTLLLVNDPASQVRFLSELPKKDRKEILKLMDEVLKVLRDEFVSRKSPDNLQFFASPSEIPEEVRKIPSARIIASFDRILKAKTDLEGNGAVPLVLTDLLLNKN